MVAFLQQVEGMDEHEYKVLVGEGGHTHAGDTEDGHGHDHGQH